MRKGLRIGCLLLAFGLLLGCGGATASQPSVSPEPTFTVQAEPTPVPAEEVVAEVVIEPVQTPVPTLPPTPTPSPTPTPTPTPTPSPTPVPTPFGIAWLPDTQTLAYSYPEKLEALGAEIAARREPDRLVAVLHTGDVVDNGYKDWEWENFDLCLNAFKDDLPFYPVAGNHDLGVKLLKYDAYLKQPFLEKLPEGQTYEGGKMYYILLEEGGVELLLLCVGWDSGKTDAERAWIETVFEQFPETPCILLTHGFLKTEGIIFPTSQYLETNIVAPHRTVRMVICGHSRDSGLLKKTYDDDGDGEAERTVTMLMLNRQGKAYAYRILTVDPLAHSIDVKTYAIGKREPLEKDDLYPLSFTIDNAF